MTELDRPTIDTLATEVRHLQKGAAKNCRDIRETRDMVLRADGVRRFVMFVALAGGSLGGALAAFGLAVSGLFKAAGGN